MRTIRTWIHNITICHLPLCITNILNTNIRRRTRIRTHIITIFPIIHHRRKWLEQALRWALVDRELAWLDRQQE
jgi:hypothetical protein